MEDLLIKLFFLFFSFLGGTKDYKVLMDKFHYVSTAFLELGARSFLFQILILCNYRPKVTDYFIIDTSIFYYIGYIYIPLVEQQYNYLPFIFKNGKA